MFERFKAANDNNENVENLDRWRELKEEAPSEAHGRLEKKGLVADIEAATTEQVEKLVAELPAMIDELSYDEKRNVKNVNRYVVRELSVLENKAQLYLSYLRASEPAATRFEADNDNDNISVAKVA